MLQYKIIHRKAEPLANHFEDVTNFLVGKFREYRKDYVGRLYDVALIPSSISERVKERVKSDMPNSSGISQWHWTMEIGVNEICQVFNIDPTHAVMVLRKKEGETGAVHFDIITPYSWKEVGNKVYRGKGTFEMDLFSDIDVIPHLGQRMDKYLIRILRERYSI